MSWTRVANTTINEHLREEEANILRNRKVTALLRERGRISYNHGGDEFDWRFRYKRAPLVGFGDADTISFPRRNRWLKAQLPWRANIVGESGTKFERLQNKGTEAIVKFWSRMAEIQKEDLEEAFADELYLDGNLAANSKKIHGFETVFKDAGNTLTEGTGVERSANAADRVAAPNTTYAGHSTQLGALGGTWDGSFPRGKSSVDQSYDSWSPLLVNWASTAWSPTPQTFAATGKEVTRFMIHYSHRNKSRKGMMDLVLYEKDLYLDFCNLLDDKERFIARPGGTAGSLVALGFTDAVNFDGAEVTSEYGMPLNTGYGLNLDHIELLSMQKQLFVAEGPFFDPGSQSTRFTVDFYGNMKINPRYQGKTYNYKA